MIPETFISYLSNELNRSHNTVEAYIRDITQFENWVTSGQSHTFDPASITTADIRSWIGMLAKTDSPTTLRRKTQSLRAYFRWMLKNKIVESNPASDVVLAKKAKHLPEFVRETEMEEIINRENPECGGNDPILQARNHLILNLLYSTGIRQAELLGINDADISFSSKEMKVTGKRNKQRVIPLPSPLIQEIKEWQILRNEHWRDLPVPTCLFPGEKGRLSKMQLYRIVKQGLQSSSSQIKSPHVLRHTFATSMLNHGANLDTVKEMLGHSSLTTTEIYTHLSFDQLRKNYNTAHPRAKQNNEK